MEREEAGRWGKLHQLPHPEHLSSCALLPLLYVISGRCTFGGSSAFPLEALVVGQFSGLLSPLDFDPVKDRWIRSPW